MKYLLLAYTPAAAWDEATAGTPSEEALAGFAAYQKFERELVESGEFVTSEGLGQAVQEALLVASRVWPVDGVPERPRGWLIRIGYRKMVDLLRAEQARRRREQSAGSVECAMRELDRREDTPQEADDSLTLLLLCCHPALSTTSQVAPHTAGGGRSYDRRDRPRLRHDREHHGYSDQPR